MVPNGAPPVESTPAAETPPPPARRPELQRRLDQVAAYGAASLNKRNLLLAVLGSTNSGLMTLNLLMEESLVQAMAGAPLPLEQIQKLQPTIDAYLRVTRQIDRFAQLEIKPKSRGPHRLLARTEKLTQTPIRARVRGVFLDSKSEDSEF